MSADMGPNEVDKDLLGSVGKDSNNPFDTAMPGVQHTLYSFVFESAWQTADTRNEDAFLRISYDDEEVTPGISSALSVLAGRSGEVFGGSKPGENDAGAVDVGKVEEKVGSCQYLYNSVQPLPATCDCT